MGGPPPVSDERQTSIDRQASQTCRANKVELTSADHEYNPLVCQRRNDDQKRI